MAVKKTNQSLSWTIQNSSELYGIDRWGKGYFTINEKGNISICPNGSKNKSHDLMELLDELESRKLKFPLLIRFDDILEDCLKNLHKAFEKAIQSSNKVAMSLSDLFCVERHKSHFLELVENKLDITFANEQEILSLIDAKSIDEVISFSKNLKKNKKISKKSCLCRW